MHEILKDTRRDRQDVGTNAAFASFPFCSLEIVLGVLEAHLQISLNPALISLAGLVGEVEVLGSEVSFGCLETQFSDEVLVLNC